MEKRNVTNAVGDSSEGTAACGPAIWPNNPAENCMDRVTDSAAVGCVGSSIKVSAGHYVDLAFPKPEAIDLQTIANALSRICRFGGHCPQFYSVAEHSLHATYAALRDGLVGEALRAVLMHDATEAYLGDIVRPLKQMLPVYEVLEERMERAIGARYGIDFKRWRSVIMDYDNRVLKAEKMEFWPDDEQNWTGFNTIQAAPVQFIFCEPQVARRRFLQMATALKISD